MTELIVVPEQSMWWLAVQGKPTGPCTAAYLLAALRCGLVHPDQLATPVEGSAWQRVADWPEFSKTSTRSERRIRTAWFGRELWNPFFHRVVIWYFIVGAPLALFSNCLVMTCSPYPYLRSSRVWDAQVILDAWDLLNGLSLTVLGVVGGLRLRDRRRDARFWLIGVVVTGWVLFAITNGFQVVLAAFADEASRNLEAETFEETGTAAVVFSLETFTATFVWLVELTAVIWLGLRGDTQQAIPVSAPDN